MAKRSKSKKGKYGFKKNQQMWEMYKKFALFYDKF